MKALLLALCASVTFAAQATDLNGPASFTFFENFKQENQESFSIDWGSDANAGYFFQGYHACYKGDIASVTSFFEYLVYGYKEANPGKTITASLVDNGDTTLNLTIVTTGKVKGRLRTSTLNYAAIPVCVR